MISDGWAVLEWECCIKSAEQGARKGRHSSLATSFKRPARLLRLCKVGADQAANRRMLGLT